MATQTALLEVRNLVRHSRGQDRRLLDDVSFTLGGGDRIAVLGPTGSGKTLLLRALSQLDPIDSGELSWGGQPVSSMDVPNYRCCVTYLSQQPSMFAGTVEQNLRFPFSLHAHRSDRFNRDAVIAQLRFLGRDSAFLYQDTSDLSGGEAQLVALLRAVELAPQVLLLDEPTAALDDESTRLVEQLVDLWFAEHSEQRAFLWVTHDVAQAERVAEHVWRMQSGRLEDQPP